MKDAELFEYMCNKFDIFSGNIFNIKSDNSKYLRDAELNLIESGADKNVLKIYQSEIEKHFDYLLEDYLRKAMYFGIKIATEISKNIELLEDDED